MTSMLKRALAVAIVLGVAGAASAHDWNDGQIAWKDYQDGLAGAKKEKKPVCLIFFTER